MSSWEFLDWIYINKYIKDADLVKNVSNQHLKFLLYTLKNNCVIKSIYIREKERQGGKYREKETARRKKKGRSREGKDGEERHYECMFAGKEFKVVNKFKTVILRI